MDKFYSEVNEVLQGDIKNLTKCSILKNQYEQKLNDINAEIEEKKRLNFLIPIENKIQQFDSETMDLKKRINNYLCDNQNVSSKIRELHSKLDFTYSKVYYLLIIQNIQLICKKLKENSESKNDFQCLKQLNNLIDVKDSLEVLPYVNLRKSFYDLIKNDFVEIKENLINKFNNLLKEINWPYLNSKNANISFEQIEKLQCSTKCLLKLELLENSCIEIRDQSVSYIPIKLMIEPFKKRFFYHFYGKKLTNAIEKPEWYLTQSLNWIQIHLKYLQEWIDPIFAEDQLYDGLVPNLQFARDIIRLNIDKFNGDIFKVIDNETLFNHYIDEALEFDKDLMRIIDYPANQINIYHILTQNVILDKWISMEKKRSNEKMDEILSADDALDLMHCDDETKITKCGDAFITLLYLLTNRYENITKSFIKLKFLDLQLELFDDFRIRLLQLSNIESDDLKCSKLPFILNTVDYIENILMEWGSNLHFLSLLNYKQQQNQMINNNSVFDDVLELYKIMSSDILLRIIDKIFVKIKNKSYNYRNERWSIMPKISNKNLSLTISACDFFHVLLTDLYLLKEKLTVELFELSWRMIVKKLDSFLFHELILVNKFNLFGAMQLQFDFVRNLFPIFYQYTKKSQNYFPLLRESVILLNIEKEEAIKIWKILTHQKSEKLYNYLDLKSINVTKLSSDLIVEILESRTDVNYNY